MTPRRILVVAGPTCSGKSALAMALAEQLGGIVINADAMQTYRELQVLTARPTPADEARVPHALYGIRPAAEPANAAWWREAAHAVIAATDRLPILCGGTGLYLNALLQGLADIPDPGEPARAEARTLLAELGAPALHARLLQADPATAARLRPTDAQRIARAWEVWRGTGRGLSAWHAATPQRPSAFNARAIMLNPPRATLREAITCRWHHMIAHGAIDEVAALRAQNLDPALPALRAHGVPELSAYLAGTISLPEAGDRAILATGQYTKRQSTWLKHHSLARNDHTFNIDARWSDEAQFSSEIMPAMMDFLSHAD
jgi:tRNA dimethylallyltransferase